MQEFEVLPLVSSTLHKTVTQALHVIANQAKNDLASIQLRFSADAVPLWRAAVHWEHAHRQLLRGWMGKWVRGRRRAAFIVVARFTDLHAPLVREKTDEMSLTAVRRRFHR